MSHHNQRRLMFLFCSLILREHILFYYGWLHVERAAATAGYRVE